MAGLSSNTGESLTLKTNYTRLVRLLMDEGTHALREYLLSVHPTEELDIVLSKNKAHFQRLKKAGKIFKDQWETLFPSSGDPSDIHSYDITLLHLLLREICNLKEPSTGWNVMPDDSDTSREASITRIKCIRNKLCHIPSPEITTREFQDFWNKISMSLVTPHREKINRLKNSPIDQNMQHEVEEHVRKWKSFGDEDELFSCLPDEAPHVFGRSTEIKKVIDAVQSGSVSVVLITGGPGIGKTSVANEAAHALDGLKDGRTVFFCSLRSKATLNDVAITMVLACDKNHAQLPENPKRFLRNWSRQPMQNVTFVLDNAEDVLHSDDRDEFSSLLSDMRIFSRKKITFVITSREEFRGSNLNIREVPLDCLSPDEATKVLVSRVPIQEREKLSKPERLVELCGHVPLALCIAGSLLQDYTEDELITRLQEEPLDILQDSLAPTDQQSVEKAISTSFHRLDENERNGLVLLSLFQGSFNYHSAKAVIEECSEITVPAARIIRSLRSKSLLQHNVNSDKHQIHLLIQEFAKKIGRRSYPHVLTHGKHLVCNHFISRLASNAELYWGKDTCKQSLEAFNEDRHNFEYFLEVYGEEMEKNDSANVEITETFPDNFVQTSMYLEQCVLPSFYMELLERLVKSPQSEKQPVHKVELFCLLGHEYRKVGSRDKYKDVMEKARNLYPHIRSELDAEPLSEVLFLNSNARFLSEEIVPDEPQKQYQKALRVCEKLGDHPERAATLLVFGRNLKRRKKRTEAEEMLKQALELFKKCLGTHIMTAMSFKDIADFYLSSEKDLDKSLAHYQDALEMMKELDVDDRKECVLTLKNYAAYHEKKGNLKQAIDLFQKADEIAQRELEEDHVWKVMIKTNLAPVYEEIGDNEKAISSMREGLEMCDRLDMTRDRLGNKNQIREFIKRHPEAQPQSVTPQLVKRRGCSRKVPKKEVLQKSFSKTFILQYELKEEGAVWELKEAAARITFPPQAVTEPQLITCSLWNPKTLSPPLDENEVLVSNVIELSRDDVPGLELTGDFNKEVTLTLSHSATDLAGYEVVIRQLIDQENNKWKDLETTNTWHESDSTQGATSSEAPEILVPFAEAKLTQCSSFAVIWRLKYFTFSIKTTSSTPAVSFTVPEYPGVSVAFPEGALRPTGNLSLTIKVQEVPRNRPKGKDMLASPVLHLSCSQSAEFLEPVTVTMPVSLRDDKKDIPDLSSCHVRVLYLNSEAASPEWREITEELESPVDVKDGVVTFQVKHFSVFWTWFDWGRQSLAALLLQASDLYKSAMPQEAAFLACLCDTGSCPTFQLALCCYPIHIQSRVKKDILASNIVRRQGDGNAFQPMCKGDMAFVSLLEALEPVRDTEMDNFHLRFLGDEPFLRSDLLVHVEEEGIPQVRFIKRQENQQESEVLCSLSINPLPQTDPPLASRQEYAAHQMYTLKSGQPSNGEMLDLAGEIVEDWKRLAIALGLSNTEVAEIDIDERWVRAKAYQMLVKWKQKFASEATYRKLADGLANRAVERSDLVDIYCCE